MSEAWFGATPAEVDVVGVTLTPDGVQPVSRAAALAARLAFGLAAVDGDDAAVGRRYAALDNGELDAVVLRKVWFVMMSGVVRPCLDELGDAAPAMRARFRKLFREFDDMLAE